MKKENFLQLFASEQDVIKTEDLEPAISIDFTSRLVKGIDNLRKILGITEMVPMAAGTQIKAYKMEVTNTPSQVPEGDIIPLTNVERTLAWTKTLDLKKYRKATTAEAIQKSGYDRAVNMTDEKVVKGVQKDIKSAFFTAIETGTGTVAATNLQTAMSGLWGKLQVRFEDMEVTPVYFIHPSDVADYLGSAQVTMQTAFGLTYIENFMGIGNAFITTGVTAGSPVATATENLNGVYIPADGDVADAFSLTVDETGMVGMTHRAITDRATIDTLIMAGVMFFPEYADGVFKATITPATPSV